MNISPVRSAGWAAACILTLAGIGCDALNPAFVTQLGGDAGASGPAPTGSIVLVLNNQTGQPIALTYDQETVQPGGETLLQEDAYLVVPVTYWTTTFDCNTTSVTLKSIDLLGTSGTLDPTNAAGSLPFAANTLTRPALQCGSVIFVNVPLIGSPTADLLP